jgi:hypothetical protein
MVSRVLPQFTRLLADEVGDILERGRLLLAVVQQQPRAYGRLTPDFVDGSRVKRQLERIGVTCPSPVVDDFPGAVVAPEDRVDTCGVPKLCSHQRITRICRRNRALTCYRDDAEKLRG